MLSEQVTRDILAKFADGDGVRKQTVAAWMLVQRQAGDGRAARACVERRPPALGSIDSRGNLEDEEYQRRRADLLAEREALPVEVVTSADVGRLAFLADLPSAWEAAAPEERNRLARQLFAQAVIEYRTVVELKPRPELRPFVADLFNGKRRGSVTRDRAGFTTTSSNVMPGKSFTAPINLDRRRRKGRIRVPTDQQQVVAALAEQEGLRKRSACLRGELRNSALDRSPRFA